ncbi:MAG: methylated-DNA--[protein]-cysteine S-methyltransferase [Anaerolineaceae bacterium]
MENRLHFDSPIGTITVISSGRGIAQVKIGTSIEESIQAPDGGLLLASCKQQILEYLSCKRRQFDLPLDWEMTGKFQREVLQLTREIPFGEVRTYGELARALGKSAASRAVGGALARNPLPLLIPCHRVVASTGALTGYSAASGIATKAWLLVLEGHKIVGQKLG